MPAVSTREHFSTTVDTGSGIAHVRRLPLPFESVAELDVAFAKVFRVLEGLDRSRSGLVLDLRAGAMRNDPVFESRLARLRPQLFAGFRRAAVIVSTALGQAQVERHARQDGLPYKAFLDETEAWNFARGQPPPP